MARRRSPVASIEPTGDHSRRRQMYVAAKLSSLNQTLTIRVVAYISVHDSIVQQRTDALLEAVAQQDQVEQEEHRRQMAILEAEQGGYSHLTVAPIQEDDQGNNALDIVPSTEGSVTETARQDSKEDAPAPSMESPPFPTTLVITTGAQ